MCTRQSLRQPLTTVAGGGEPPEETPAHIELQPDRIPINSNQSHQFNFFPSYLSSEPLFPGSLCAAVRDLAGSDCGPSPHTKRTRLCKTLGEGGAAGRGLVAVAAAGRCGPWASPSPPPLTTAAPPLPTATPRRRRPHEARRRRRRRHPRRRRRSPRRTSWHIPGAPTHMTISHDHLTPQKRAPTAVALHTPRPDAPSLVARRPSRGARRSPKIFSPAARWRGGGKGRRAQGNVQVQHPPTPGRPGRRRRRRWARSPRRRRGGGLRGPTAAV